ncbi:hypothetical protein [Rhizobium sp.]|uniref:hypothetical protein n=1 Tax=Rhizobium sp. TaxID=391 RepID=UPI00289A0B66
MGVATAIIFLSLASWWFAKANKTAITWLGFVIFVLGLVPITAITSFHPYMLLAIGQALVTFPLVPIGVAVMVFGQYLYKSKLEQRDP